MDDGTLRKAAKEGTAAEVKVLIEQYGKTAFSYSDTGIFACYGIRHIEAGISQSTVEKAEKQELLEVFKNPGASRQELRELRAEIAAQGERLEELRTLMIAFLEATLPDETPAQPAAAQKPKKTLSNALR
ncbi:MAG: hypothetical protein KGL10_01525 [Alphaproteobacteria bacterium]|nr:hypothetical protein [Alphaproteobacteria bacterium]MDE2335967.1 hypothetical protein [Alphaproteobacteria bacterium]